MDFFLLFSLTLLYTTISFTGADDFTPVTAAEGENCTLPCNISKKISSLEWTHSALKKCLLVFRAERVQEEYEDPKYRDRVQLVDPQLHSGDLSVVLKNITSEDTGTYECQVFIKDNQKTSQFIHLRVTAREQGNEEPKALGGFSILASVLIVLGLVSIITLFISVLGFRCWRQKSGKSLPSDSEKCLEMIKDANPPFKSANSLFSSDESLCCESPFSTSSVSSQESGSSTAGLLQTSDKR